MRKQWHTRMSAHTLFSEHGAQERRVRLPAQDLPSSAIAGWTNRHSARWMLVLMSITAECYALAWDVLMDWGFVKGWSRHLLYPWTWVYPVVLLVDVLGRFMFLTTSSQGPPNPIQPECCCQGRHGGSSDFCNHSPPYLPGGSDMTR